MRKALTWIIGLAAAAAALAVIALLAMDWPNRPQPVDAEAIRTRAAAYQGRISRDAWGVPHIQGPRNVDAAFALGYAHSEDDFQTIQAVVLATRGTLAAVDGLKAAPTDYLVQMMRIWDDLDARYEKDLPPDVRAILDAYADGVTHYALNHPESVAPGLVPLTGKDVAAGFAFKTPLFYGLDGELKKLLAPEAPKGPEKGSNGVAVAPSRATDGVTRLLVNSHQPYTGPVAWYEAVVESGEGWHVAGGFFPGSPFMLHGHNENLGWANTVNSPDLVDIYKLTLDPKDPNAYMLDGKSRPFERKMGRIRVKLFGPFYWTAEREMIWSEHGMAFRTPRGVFAVRYAGQREIRGALEYWRLDTARTAEEWRAALALQALPSINYIYADRTGLIGYVYNGLFPARAPGADWRSELPGDRSDLIWTSYLPFDRIPQIWAPKSGLIFNSNNTPFQATADDAGLKAEAFPAEMGIQTNMTNRAWRALETYGADPAISRDEFHAYKYDIAYSPKSDQMRLIGEILAMRFDDPDLTAGQAILRSWDGRTDRGNRGAALGVAATADIVWAMTHDDPVPDLAAKYKESVAELKALYGRLDPAWSEVMHFRRGALDLPIDGGPDTFRAVYGEKGKDGGYTASGGDTLIIFVDWDKAGRVSSESIHQFGSATLDASSKHYADQAPLFARMQTKPVLFWRTDQDGKMVQTYTPGAKRR